MKMLNRNMTTTKLLRWSGIASILGGVLLLALGSRVSPLVGMTAAVILGLAWLGYALWSNQRIIEAKKSILILATRGV